MAETYDQFIANAKVTLGYDGGKPYRVVLDADGTDIDPDILASPSGSPQSPLCNGPK